MTKVEMKATEAGTAAEVEVLTSTVDAVEPARFEPKNKTFMIGKVYHHEMFNGDKYKVTKIENGFVTLKQIETQFEGGILRTCRYKLRVRENFDDDGNVVGVIQYAELRIGRVEAIDEVIDLPKSNAQMSENAVEKTTEPARFEVGKTYFVDMGDDIYRYFKVVSRKGKKITVESNDGGVYESKEGRILPRNIHGNFETAKGIMMSELVHACDEVNAEFLKAEEDRKAREYAKLLEECAEDEEIEESQLAEEGEFGMTKALENAPSVEKIPLAEKITDLKSVEKIVSEKYLNVCRNLYVKIDDEYHSAVGFDDYVTKYHDIFYCKEGKNYVEDTAAYNELKAIESEWNAIFKKLAYFESIEAKADILKAKIAEQKKKSQANHRLGQLF